jgi:drug/metabolite transporter (DMT)-like permease
VLRKEPFPLEHKIGAGCMVLGAVIILGKSYGGFVFGDLFILAATFFAPFGNMFSQKCREIASSETILFLRSFFSGCALLGIAVILGEHTVMDKAFSVLPVLLLNGVVIFGVSKLFWLEGIHRMPVTKAIIMQSMTPLLTLLFAWFLLSQAPTVWQLSSVVPLLLGVILLTGQFRIKKIRNPFDKKPLLEP